MEREKLVGWALNPTLHLLLVHTHLTTLFSTWNLLGDGRRRGQKHRVQLLVKSREITNDTCDNKIKLKESNQPSKEIEKENKNHWIVKEGRSEKRGGCLRK